MSVGKHVDFGMVDEKGRKIGAEVYIFTSHHGCRVYVQATRDGEAFGPAAPERPVANFEDAKREVTRRLTSMAKRYTKKLKLLAEGCHAKWVDRATGVTLTVRDADDDDPAVPYMVVCEAHDTCVGVGSKSAGRSCSGIDFCDDCRAAAEGGQS